MVIFLLVPLLLVALKAHLCVGVDTTFPGQHFSGNQRLASKGGVFELGFFTPGNSKSYYVGVWYKGQRTQTVVWVANRDQPVSDPFSSELRLLENGSLALINSSKMVIWSANVMPNMHNMTVAMILDSRNFVLCKKLEPSNIVWQSFDYPINRWLPGAKLGFNISLRSWRNLEDPAPGRYLATVEPRETGNGNQLLWEILDLEEEEESLKQSMPIKEGATDKINVTDVLIEGNFYSSYSSMPSNTLMRFVLDSSGQLQLFAWENSSHQRSLIWAKPTKCGAFSVYNRHNVPICVCLKGFIPDPPGCIRRTILGCPSGRVDRFIVVHNTSYSGTPSEGLVVGKIKECELACLRNCSCFAYSYDDYTCLIWKGYLPYLQQLSPDDATGKNMYVRVAASEVMKTKAMTKRKAIGIATSIATGAAILIFTLLCVAFRKMMKRKDYSELDAAGGSLIMFKYRDLNIATKRFSEKLGEGGFGLVYRGTLPNSTAIAVKQLKSSGENEKQFLAEVNTIGRIQHINLVRLRGFCAEASKKLLVYDYMPNGSLASLLFQNHDETLNWRTAYHIAVGTARGIAYLHEKCIHCIIHCDIKPENVLLDSEYNPKVADFGLAKLIGRDFSRILTTMRGTRGYLAPEWMSGLPISAKADVYSYGKLLLEVVSRKRNMDTLDNSDICNYFPYRVADALSKGEDILTLLHYSLEDSDDINRLTRACKVACWCIQDDEKDRPSMGQVVNILEGFIEAETPPIPRYFRCLKDDPVKATFYQETSSSSSL
ncbi:hypothetical protein DITRI_Ditri06bG0153600 [Diplodiscus trichospermus]